ncbi:Na(+)-translocating NADH-quinone reductase subunit C [Shewanella livingstonensis]|uniref:Na(+)-translocating NADH-quinone reductase subunit C n=1 Tax=Shewanella livingstonensis TaxID=150120 RepID=A0A3G8LTA2_9GAMM|nr:Na(+)-translocating NADH-quinone reductase subunit C [Shewanella livingstonensis]AZG72445.1 Na(+)-translocating NADH-quinone reductase subunit C [Shewanella livingstonensis]
MASNKDSFGRTLFVVVGLCLICSVLVSTAAVVLKPIQQENKLLDKQKYILEAASLINTKEGKVTKKEILSKYEQYVEARLVDLKTGEFVEGDANVYDQRKASRDTSMSSVPENDIASIKRVADNAVVYLVRNDEGKLTSVILPVHGYGLWSTMYALLALEADLNTVQGLVYYDQGETPGLGGEVENPKWKALWKGKKLFDEQGDLAISVTKNPTVASSVYGVDALSGATLTSNGVQHSLTFWLGKEGFANFIAKARNGGLS